VCEHVAASSPAQHRQHEVGFGGIVEQKCEPARGNRLVRFSAVATLVISALAAGIAAALRLTQLRATVAPAIPALASISSTPESATQDAGQSTGLLPGNMAQTNILELPKASTDFVGYWGGYVHSSIHRLSPDLIGTSPDRVSVVFGRQGDTVFMASELYSSPNQKIVRRPNARIAGPRVAIVEYESADNDLYYICSHRFRLKDASSINYRSTVEVYDLNSHRLVGIVTERAMLKRLLTPVAQLPFARPARNQIPRAEISARSGSSGH